MFVLTYNVMQKRRGKTDSYTTKVAQEGTAVESRNLAPAGAPTHDRLLVLGSPVVLYFTRSTVINIHV